MTGTTTYRRTVAAWADKAGEQLGALARVATQDLCEDVIDHTRIDTGFLVGNWQPSLGAPLLSVDEVGSGNGYAESKMVVTIADFQAGDVFYYVNNAAYARRREYGFVGHDSLGRYYNERGDHMVSNAIAKWDIFVAGAAQRLGLLQ